jgi:hypothetical protein
MKKLTLRQYWEKIAQKNTSDTAQKNTSDTVKFVTNSA